MHTFQELINAMLTVPRFRILFNNVRSGPLVACGLERHDLRQLAVSPKPYLPNNFAKTFYPIN
jgi:hypothetical protein